MGYEHAHAPIYGYTKGAKHTIPLHIVHYARTFSIFKLLNKLSLGKVLNVGGADGYHSYLMQKIFNADVTTLDINSQRLSIAEKRYGLLTKEGSATNIPYKDNTFDTVICIETIEHIHDSEKVVSELKRVAKNNVIISTESFFDSEEQKTEFLLYLHETHPQFFRQTTPEKPGDVAYFTRQNFYHLFETKKIKFYPQFSSKIQDIVAPIEDVREAVRTMTESLSPSKQTKVIVHYSETPLLPEPLHPEDVLLNEIVSNEPLFPLTRDPEMDTEDDQYRQYLNDWHQSKHLCEIIPAIGKRQMAIEEVGAKNMHLHWLTADNLEKSPAYCTRKIILGTPGCTPQRNTSWEHQLYILSGNGTLVEQTRTTPLEPGMTILIPPYTMFQVINSNEESDFVYLDIIPSITKFFGR